MRSMTMRYAVMLLLAALAGCSAIGVRPTGPAGQASTTDVNPITGTRGGSGSAN